MASSERGGPRPEAALGPDRLDGECQVVPRQRAVSPLERLADLAEQSLPATIWQDPRVRLLAAGWLSGFRSPRTKRAYAGDLLIWQRWCTANEIDPLRARRVQVDLYLTNLLDGGASPASASRRLSALSSFYRFLLEQDDLDIARPTPPPRFDDPPSTLSTPPRSG